jgi:hypothetical protein
MEKNISKIITFDNLENEDLEKIDDTSHDLVNKNCWSEEEFQYIYFKRKNKFSSNDLELKKEYNKWHKELGLKYYDPHEKKFRIHNLTMKQKIKTSPDLIKYLLRHPLLDNKDKKHVKSIIQNQNYIFFRNSVMNTILGIFVLLMIFRKLAKIQKVPLPKLIKKNFFFSILAFLLSMVVLDVSYRMKNHRIVTDYLYENHMVDKYFQNYLI